MASLAGLILTIGELSTSADIFLPDLEKLGTSLLRVEVGSVASVWVCECIPKAALRGLIIVLVRLSPVASAAVFFQQTPAKICAGNSTRRELDVTPTGSIKLRVVLCQTS